MSFNSLGLSPDLLKAVAQLQYEKPTPIQQQAIPAIIAGKDILGIAKTGSGKTASYALPILNKLQANSNLKNRHVKVLVLVPTRELAVQVTAVFQQIGNSIPDRIKSLAVFGGVAINPQMQALQHVSVLVATPGRLLELERSNAMSLSEVEILVLDEADKMLNLGFKDEMDEILKLLPKKRQNLLFSATLSDDVAKVNRILLKDPAVIKIAEEKETIDLINQSAYFIAEEKKGPLLRYLIKYNDLKQVLIFTSSTRKADNLTEKLLKNGIDTTS